MDNDLDVGERLRMVRRQAGLSQRALSKKAGVANSMVSQIEAGKINPSVGALKRILDGVPIGLAEFFSFEGVPEREVFFAAESLKEIGKGSLSLKQVGNNLLGRSLQILYETYEANADTGRVLYNHEGEEGGVVISGRIEVTVGDQRRILGPGDAYLFESRVPHRFRAVGAEKCILVSACTPPSF
ncbi:cupin domain-containing protein [Cohaesibacter celericrescens]|uniref:XRE family transcriptional regulator n=1 Tax=Cohaesibacter celericrescens TaxID=2067669 RepID=A0A2N5XTS7_9HYPH|nr:cupin domain-containing protein [Cohaesibacter celericrescens]PLW77818.1 XRE family transcriptional regulator [Cohaesibacter celericrescens]